MLTMTHLDWRALQVIIVVLHSSGHHLTGVVHQGLVNHATVPAELRRRLFLAGLAGREQRNDRHEESLVDVDGKLLDQQLTVPATVTDRVTHLDTLN